jgi:hypothetical protein
MLARLAAAEAIREHRAEVDEARFPFYVPTRKSSNER